MKIAPTAFLMLLSVVDPARCWDRGRPDPAELREISGSNQNLDGPKTKTPHPAPGKLIDIGGYRLHLNCNGTKARRSY
jgi:hypothetical protein